MDSSARVSASTCWPPQPDSANWPYDTRVTVTIRSATRDDIDAAMALMPRLAAFDVPARRNPEHLWKSDAALLESLLTGGRNNAFALVAESAGTVVGVALVSLRPELLSKEPSAHLEAIAVATGTERRGIGKQLLESAEAEAARRGARSITLHVFGNNSRARAFYANTGYDEELIRCSKVL